MKNLKIVLMLFLLILVIGCTTEVQTGYVGMVQKPHGLTGEVLSPGFHTCFNRDVMMLVEVSENVTTEKMKILCSDDLNFGFDLKIRAQLLTTQGKALKGVLNKKGSAATITSGNTKTLKFVSLYNTYVKPEARAIARGVVSKYRTTEISSNREKIDAEIKNKLAKSLIGTPMAVNMIVSSNYDYPDVITRAMEKKRQREIEIDEEKAKQAVELLKANNRLKIAQKMKITRAAEAQAESAYNKILGNSLTQKYLKLRDIEAKLKLYDNVGPGDKVIVTGSAVPLINTK